MDKNRSTIRQRLYCEHSKINGTTTIERIIYIIKQMNDTNFVDRQPTKDHEICHYQTSPPCDRQEHGDQDDEPGTLDLDHKNTLWRVESPRQASQTKPPPA